MKIFFKIMSLFYFLVVILFINPIYADIVIRVNIFIFSMIKNTFDFFMIGKIIKRKKRILIRTFKTFYCCSLPGLFLTWKVQPIPLSVTLKYSLIREISLNRSIWRKRVIMSIWLALNCIWKILEMLFYKISIIFCLKSKLLIIAIHQEFFRLV